MQFHRLHSIQTVHDLQAMEPHICFLYMIVILNSPGIWPTVLDFDKIMLTGSKVIACLVPEDGPNTAHDDDEREARWLF